MPHQTPIKVVLLVVAPAAESAVKVAVAQAWIYHQLVLILRDHVDVLVLLPGAEVDVVQYEMTA